MDRTRNIRNELLNKPDKYILSDYPISLSQQMIIQQMIIKTYRETETERGGEGRRGRGGRAERA